jgi:formate hydrogenlyase subunit 4
MALTVALAPALPGVATRTRSALTGRRGPPVLQLYFDLAKLARKRPVVSRATTWIFTLAPAIVVAATLIAATLLPLDGRSGMLRFSGDLVAFAALLAVGRFALMLASLDTGSSFEGMGASREAMVSTLVEPALFLAFVVLVIGTGDLSLSGLLGEPLARLWPRAAAALVLTAISVFLVLLAENARVPVDDPATHLELTMIHEVMILDHSGPSLALLLYGSALKMALFAAIVARLVVSRLAMPVAATVVVVAIGMVGVAAVVGVVESVMARLRLPRVPQFLVTASALSALALFLGLIA